VCSVNHSLVANNVKDVKITNDISNTIKQKKQNNAEDDGEDENEDEDIQTSVVSGKSSADPMRIKMLQAVITGVLLRDVETALAMLSLNESNTVPRDEQSDDDL
jgi:hypothetical protein